MRMLKFHAKQRLPPSLTPLTRLVGNALRGVPYVSGRNTRPVLMLPSRQDFPPPPRIISAESVHKESI